MSGFQTTGVRLRDRVCPPSGRFLSSINDQGGRACPPYEQLIFRGVACALAAAKRSELAQLLQATEQPSHGAGFFADALCKFREARETSSRCDVLVQ
jgi:hypothetical protein